MHSKLHGRKGAWLPIDNESGRIYLHLWLLHIIHPYSSIATNTHAIIYVVLYVYSYVRIHSHVVIKLSISKIARCS